MSLTAEERSTKLQALLENGWKMTDGRDAIEKTFMFKVRPMKIVLFFFFKINLLRNQLTKSPIIRWSVTQSVD